MEECEKRKTDRLSKTARPFNFTTDIDGGMHLCPQCLVPFIDKSARDAHYIRHNKVKVYNCNICLKPFKNKTTKCLHERFHNREVAQKGGNQIESDVVVEDEEIEDDGVEFIARANALDGVVRVERLNFSNNKKLIIFIYKVIELKYLKIYIC